jgi:fluoride ion exporter CrcB/FEX
MNGITGFSTVDLDTPRMVQEKHALIYLLIRLSGCPSGAL